MEHLFNSRVKVQRLDPSASNGMATYTWVDQPSPLDYLKCRIDVQFLRPGKDIPKPFEAGKAPENTGVLFYSRDVKLLAGDRLVCVPNDAAELPVEGVFEIRNIPDTAQDAARSHHFEVQVFEVAQAFAGDRVFPGEA